jgi:hypothetical protein
MSYNTFPTLQGLGWPIKVTPKFKTIVQQAASGAEYRTALWQNPLRLIDIPINFMTKADYQTLLNFFIQQQGSLTPFYITPTQNSWVAANIPFGSWNGSNNTAGLVDSRGNPISSADVTSIYQTDWQGTNQLSPTPRTNLAGYTVMASGTAFIGLWLPYYSAAVQSGFSAPDGSMNAIEITQNPSSPGVPYGGYYNTPTQLPNGDYVCDVWVRMLSGTAQIAVSPDDTGNNLTTTVGTAWSKVVHSFPAYVPHQTRSFQVTCVTPGAGPFQVFAPQTLSGLVSGIFLPNTGAPAPATDYTLSGTQVTLAQAPQSGATTTWSGVGSNAEQYLVRFPDGIEFDQFMSQLYRTKTLKLQEVR